MKNLKSLNENRMRANEGIVYCPEGKVNMFSNASDRQVGGVSFVRDFGFFMLFKVPLSVKSKKGVTLFMCCEELKRV